MLSRALVLACVAAVSASSDIATVPLWTAYVEGWPTCFRQPILLRTEHHTLLAFVEGRPGIPWCSGTFYPDQVRRGFLLLIMFSPPRAPLSLLPLPRPSTHRSDFLSSTSPTFLSSFAALTTTAPRGAPPST